MNVEYNDWSVTIYADGDSDIPVLRKLLDKAREKDITCGSVGVIPLPKGCSAGDKRNPKFVGLSHCDKTQAMRLFKLAGLDVTSVPFKRAVVVETKRHPQKRVDSMM